MNNIIKRVWNQNRMVNIEDLRGMAFQAESGGHTFEISGIDDQNNVVPLSGTVAGVFMRPDGTDVALTGTASDGVVSVTLSDACYAVAGRFGFYIFVTSDSKKTCVYSCIGTVAQTSYGTVAGDTPQDVVDLINAINAAVATIPADYTALMAAIAPTYSNTALYAVGSYAWYDGVLYKCTTAITTAELWTAAHWTAATLGNDVSDLKSVFDEFETQVSDSELITIPRTNNNGYYIDSNGAVVSASSNYQTTDSIDISAYSILYITGRANYTHLIYAFYATNNVFISGYQSDSGGSATFIENKQVIVPSNAKYVRISNLYNNTPYPNAKYKEYTVKGTEIVPSIKDTVDSITADETYQIEFYESVTWTAGYVNKSGSISQGGTNYVYSSKIPVQQGDVIKAYSLVSGNPLSMRFLTAYDSDNNAVSSKGGENITSYTVPEGIVSVIVSTTYNADASTVYGVYHKAIVQSVVLDSANTNDVLFGKKWCVIGDSFSYGGQTPMPVFLSGRYKGCRKVYPYFIGNRTHINIVDFTANGRTLAYPTDGSFSNSVTNPSAEYYYQNIPSDSDYITIYLGINDSHHAPNSSGGDGEDNTGEIPIGTVDDATTATFGGAWNVVLSWLITNRPNAHIGIIVSNGVDNVNYRDITIEIAKKYGIAYIDLNGDERTPAMIRTVNPDISQAVKTALISKWAVEVGVNTHPNTDAHEYESYFIENFLRSI